MADRPKYVREALQKMAQLLLQLKADYDIRYLVFINEMVFRTNSPAEYVELVIEEYANGVFIEE